MPRIAGVSTPKYRKHRPTGQAVVSIAGKDYYLGPHGTKASRIEYDRLIGEWLAFARISYMCPATLFHFVHFLSSFAMAFVTRNPRTGPRIMAKTIVILIVEGSRLPFALLTISATTSPTTLPQMIPMD